MVDGDVLRPPYQTARSIAEWADHNWLYIDGRLGLSGQTIDDLSLSRLLNIAYALLVDEAATYGYHRDVVDDVLKVGWPEEAIPEAGGLDDEAALADLMDGISMDDLL